MVPFLTGAPQRREPPEEDLASIALQIQRKRFYVDIKKNRRGIFMKIAEISTDGRKARIVLTLNAAFEIKEKLKDLIDTLDEVNKDVKPEDETDTNDQSDEKPREEAHANADGLIKSHVVSYPFRRYFLDLKKNDRGYFLRLTMLSTLNRIQLAVPSQGMLDLYNAMSDLLDKWWDGVKNDEQRMSNLPESKSLRFDNKTLYFDSNSNRFGTYLRISEVRSSSRTAITIPSRSLFRFRDIINSLADDLSVKVGKTSESPSPSAEPEDVEKPPLTANGDTPSTEDN